MKKETFESKLQDKFRNYEVPVPSDVWSSIESSLPTQKKSRRLVFPIKYWGVAASVLLVAAFTLWQGSFFFRSDLADQSIRQNPSIAQSEPANVSETQSASSKEIAPIIKPSSVVAENRSIAQRKSEIRKVAVEEINPIIATAEELDDTRSLNEPVNQEKQSIDSTPDQPMTDPKSMPTQEEIAAAQQKFLADAQELKAIERQIVKQKNSRRPLSIGLLADGSSSASVSKNSFGDITLMRAPDAVNAVRMLSLANMTPYQKPTPTKINHAIPLSVGLSVQKALTTRWSLESGVVYSYLMSKLEYSGAYNREEVQRLHYVGIPLNVEFELFRRGSFSAFTKGGVMGEVNVAGNISEKSIFSGDQTLDVESSVREKGIQWSAMLGVGVGYSINDKVRFSLEPSATYYLDNGSSFITIRKEKPLNFNFKLAAVYRFK